MSKTKKQSHSTFRNGKLFCTHCGGEQTLVMPMEVTKLVDATKSFDELHKNCKPKWTQPVPDQSLTVTEKAEFWYSYGERGMSSETIYKVLTTGKSVATHHPCDPDDFRRCYMLLKMVPEWRNSLHRMKEVSSVWSALVDNWDTLTQMLEEQLAGKRNDMYQFMKKLGC